MTDFLFKSTFTMAVLLALYYFLLEREKMHRFNRFYLLGALAFSLALPFITVITYIQEIPLSSIAVSSSATTTQQAVPEEPVNYWPYIGLSVYIIISIVMTVRFMLNIVSFFRKAKSRPSIQLDKAKLILLDEKVLPHTFMNLIFINREEYETNKIENELYTHELAHVKQKHTLDILFIEALKTIFWFNPLLYFYKKAIQLNHEFLADEKVIDSTANTVYYQSLLLEKASVGTTFSLASNLTFSLTKKRFIMMTKKTSKIKSELLKISILPVAFVLLLIIPSKTKAFEEQAKTFKENTVKDSIKMVTYKPNPDEYYAGVRFIFYTTGQQTKDTIIGKAPYFDKIYEEITDEEKKEHIWLFMTPTPKAKHSPSKKELNDFKNKKKYAIWINDKEVDNSILNKYKPNDIAYFSGSVILKNARTKKHPQPFQYWLYTHDYFEKNEMHKVASKYADKEIHLYKKLCKA